MRVTVRVRVRVRARVWVWVLEAAGAVGGRIGAGRHHGATESRSARASVSEVRRLDGVVRT